MKRSARSLICVPVIGRSFPEALEQIVETRNETDLFELRIDCLRGVSDEQVKELVSSMGKPFILCVRRQDEGGDFAGTEAERLKRWVALSALNPAYVDVESSVEDSFLETIRHHFPNAALILSHHDFRQTIPNLPELLRRMQSRKAALYKIATMANSSLDGLRMLQFLKSHRHAGLIALCMGPCGEFTRVLAALAGSRIVYACSSAGKRSAPGQIPLRQMLDGYRVPQMTEATRVFGLIGDPVTKSPSDITHNSVIEKLALDAVYVKIPVRKEELSLCLRAAASFGIQGLSVTMPLKEELVKLVDSLEGDAKDCGAVNTLHFNEGRILGYNTDGRGALDALEEWMPVRGKRLVIVGAGGSARAIACEASRRGAEVSLVNRTESKALEAANLAGGRGYSFDGWKLSRQSYDAMIHCTPLGMFGMDSSLVEELIDEGKCLMDIVVSKEETALMKQARLRGCQVIGGYAMLKKQAISQFRIWTEDSHRKLNLEDAFEIAFGALP
ncbi:shikimate dehydrogenase [Estrella lausannensis]|uniref:Multifunctional fusion protein n=1 Tax=Estrella lausannensis TaxID=483423 RepID=A0A0H5DRF3_9BACT|nr:shikimate dehydrogenase [Estrella lausannensis]CRX39162.1 Shikimate biosynthesis protein AroDE [Estrella lausannensis]